jgi:hypothetical protein
MAIKHYDFIIKGNEDSLYAYLNGYLRGKGVKSGFIFTSSHPFKSHFLKELIKYHGEVVHLICRPAIRPVIRAALKQAPKEYEWEIVDSRSVKKTTFEFKFDNYQPKETFDPDAKGAEGYAPLHEYTFQGKGTIVGDVEGVLKVYQKLEGNQFIHCEEIEIFH